MARDAPNQNLLILLTLQFVDGWVIKFGQSISVEVQMLLITQSGWSGTQQHQTIARFYKLMVCRGGRSQWVQMILMVALHMLDKDAAQQKVNEFGSCCVQSTAFRRTPVSAMMATSPWLIPRVASAQHERRWACSMMLKPWRQRIEIESTSCQVHTTASHLQNGRTFWWEDCQAWMATVITR